MYKVIREYNTRVEAQAHIDRASDPGRLTINVEHGVFQVCDLLGGA